MSNRTHVLAIVPILACLVGCQTTRVPADISHSIDEQVVLQSKSATSKAAIFGDIRVEGEGGRHFATLRDVAVTLYDEGVLRVVLEGDMARRWRAAAGWNGHDGLPIYVEIKNSAGTNLYVEWDAVELEASCSTPVVSLGTQIEYPLNKFADAVSVRFVVAPYKWLACSGISQSEDELSLTIFASAMEQVSPDDLDIRDDER